MICDTSFSFCELGQNVPQFDIDPYIYDPRSDRSDQIYHEIHVEMFTARKNCHDTRTSTGVTVCACMRFAGVIRLGYLVPANQHTSSEGQGSRDLRQTRVEPYWIEIVGHSSTKHQFSLPLRIFNRL